MKSGRRKTSIRGAILSSGCVIGRRAHGQWPCRRRYRPGGSIRGTIRVRKWVCTMVLDAKAPCPLDSGEPAVPRRAFKSILGQRFHLRRDLGGNAFQLSHIEVADRCHTVRAGNVFNAKDTGYAGRRVKMIPKLKSSKNSSFYALDEFGLAFPVTAKVAISAQLLEKVKGVAHPLAWEVTGRVSQAASLNGSIDPYEFFPLEARTVNGLKLQQGRLLRRLACVS